MSHSYLVGSPDQVELMSVAEFVAAVQNRWPDAGRVQGNVIDMSSVRSLAARELFFSGSALAVQNARIESFYEIAQWFRLLVGDQHCLALGESAGGNVLQPFTRDTTLEEVKAALDA